MYLQVLMVVLLVRAHIVSSSTTQSKMLKKLNQQLNESRLRHGTPPRHIHDLHRVAVSLLSKHDGMTTT